MALLEFRDIYKSFGAIRALRGVSFSIEEGEAHALCGENGAGKSTLLKVLAGSVTPDQGELALQGESLALSSPRDALNRGIGTVYQEMLSFPSLTVTANIFAGRELTGPLGRLREAAMRERTRQILALLHLSVSPDDRAEDLSIAQRQLVQVARALAFDCRILALDEPTTSLTGAETDHLFKVLEDLRRRGVTLIYVSHRLPEVFRLCDRITVLRDGQYVGTFSRAETAPGRIVQAMVGRDLPAREAVDHEAGTAEPVLSVSGLTRRPFFEDISLSIQPGEIVGIFGLVGSGRTELLETLFGVHHPDQGEVLLAGRKVRLNSPRDAARAGIVLVPEERQRQGLFFNLNLRHNLALPAETARGSLRVRHASERAMSEAVLSRWRIKAAGVGAMPDSLSGGNQQKVVLAKWLAIRPRLILLDEPTKGVDVGAKSEIHDIIRQQAAEGSACLVVSSDLPEILALAHRIVVMREGRIRGEIRGAQADEESVMRLATTEPGVAA